ncbi:MAG: SusC/RagA family TonB-linked outer membrane protein [Bacteroidota bacterium]
MKKIALIFTILLFVGALFSNAQTREITGTVTSAEDDMPVPGVSISVKGTTLGTVTDINGEYSLGVPEDAQALVFSFIGMQTVERPITGSVINVKMEPDVLGLDEVVVVGYGTARRVGTVVGSITQVSEEIIQDKPTANVFDAMQGKVAGLQSYTSDGEPSSISSIRLHGLGSLGASSTPLYVVDGVPIDASSMLALNASDFESLTVLKDASATSIYGSRAANGVIYITTKGGKRNTKAQITVDAQYGVSSLANEEFYDQMMNTQQLTDFWIETGFRSQEQINDLLSEYPHDTKWYKYYFKENAPTAQTNISISGGSEKTNYFVSGGYFYQEGLAARSEYQRYSFRSNVSSKVNDWLSFGANISASTDERQTNPYTWNDTNLGLSSLAQPFYSPYDEDGNRFEGTIPGWGRYDNVYLANKRPAENERIQFNGMAFIQLNPIRGLVIRSQGGLDGYHNRGHSKRMPSFVGSLGNGNATESFTENYTRTLTNTVEYKFNIQNRHTFTLLAGHEGIDNNYEFFSGSSTGQTDDRLVLLTEGPENRDVDHSKSQYAYLSYFGRIDYSFNNKYFFDFSLREDASSRFGVDNREAVFYALGGMWNAKKESFIENVAFLSTLNLKASYGTSGNSSIGNYEHLALVGTNQFDGETAWTISTPGNPNLGWEEQTKLTIGTSFAIFDERYRFNIEYYDRTTKNQLIDVPYPYTSGFSEILTNVGAIKNSGVDVAFDFDAIRGKDYYLTPYFNFNYNKNEITELFQGKEYWIIPNTGVSWAIGKPVSYFYPVFAGIDPADGRPMWYVPGENRTENVEEEVTKDFNASDLEQSTGINRYAPIAGGFGLNTGWKGFSLQADFSYVLGKYLIVNDRYFFENPNVFTGFNQSTTVLDYWKEPGDIARFPGYDVAQFTQFDSRLIENASFMRLKNLTVGYSVPENLLSRVGFVEGARVFATGRNILTVTEFSGPDPEVDSNLTLGANPNTKQYTFGVELTF